MITLRPFVDTDLDLVLTWRNAPEIASYMYGDRVITTDEHTRWFASLPGDLTKQYWMICQDETDVGVAYVYDIDSHNSRASWGFYIAVKTARGHGTGYFVEVMVLAFAFDYLNLNKLCCEIFSKNKAVWSMHEKCGFQNEGIFQDHIFKDDVFHDVIVMGISHEGWQEVRGIHLKRLDRRGHIMPDFSNCVPNPLNSEKA